jgi:dTMP kinase
MLIAIEGIDGSGKGMQASSLHVRAKEAGFSVVTFSFPAYGNNPFGHAVGEYLDGRFGDIDRVAPQLAAVLYAGDRYVNKTALVNSIATNDLVIADRYVPSNLAHQAAKLRQEERPAFINWISTIEYTIFELPHASLILYLDMPVKTAADLVLAKTKRHYTSRATDIHESDLAYLQRCKDVYEQLIETDRESAWQRVLCTSTLGLRDSNSITAEIWATLYDRLVHQRVTRQTLS